MLAYKTLGEIAKNYPNTISVLNEYKLDYCCGGKDTLEVAANALQLNLNEVINTLESAMIKRSDKALKWDEMGMSEIIDHLLETHHKFMRESLEELNVLIFRVLKVHFDHHGELLLKLHQLFGTLKMELEAHLVKEEERLFPMIRRFESQPTKAGLKGIEGFIAETEAEHDVAGDCLKAISTLTQQFTPPDNICLSFRRMYVLLEALQLDTFKHVHTENSILFQKIKEVL